MYWVRIAFFKLNLTGCNMAAFVEQRIAQRFLQMHADLRKQREWSVFFGRWAWWMCDCHRLPMIKFLTMDMYCFYDIDVDRFYHLYNMNCISWSPVECERSGNKWNLLQPLYRADDVRKISICHSHRPPDTHRWMFHACHIRRSSGFAGIYTQHYSTIISIWLNDIWMIFEWYLNDIWMIFECMLFSPGFRFRLLTPPQATRAAGRCEVWTKLVTQESLHHCII